jgi:type IV pilus assembly protein PilA
MKDNKGFTLIELLIVIIIIGILAAIAIPMFLNQRDKAKDSAVKGGVHNIELGIGSYAVDNSDSYPVSSDVTKANLVDNAGSAYVDNWPNDPWNTANPMAPGAGKGSYTYTPLPADVAPVASFTLAGHLSNGDFLVP